MKRTIFSVLFLLCAITIICAQGPSVAIKTVIVLPSTCRANAVYTEMVFKKAPDATRGYYTCKSTQDGWDGPYASSGGASPGNVIGPASATDAHLAVFDGTTGKSIKDGGAIPTATPAGSDTQVQFNDGGSAFGGDAGLVYNKTTDVLTNDGQIKSPVFVSAAVDPADAGAFRLGNNECVAWEKATPGTDWTLCVNASDVLATNAPFTSAGLIQTTGTDGSQFEIKGVGLTDYKLSVSASGLYVNDVTNSKSPFVISPNAGGSLTIGTTTNTFVGTVVIPTPFTLGAISVTTTGTELNYVAGVTSAIQTQLNAKQSTITFGTGVQTALGVNIGSAGAPVLFNGAGGTPSSMAGANITGLPTTGLTGTLQAAQEPAHTGDVTNSAGSLALSIAANAVTLAKLATQATNTVLGNATSSTGVPTALSVGSCSAAGSALNWTTNTGFGCNTSIAANTATSATDTASKTGTGSTYATNTSPVFVTQITSPKVANAAGVAVQGTNTNDDAAAGYVGEIIVSEVLVGSAVSLTSVTAANITSVSLTAGDWDVNGSIVLSNNGSTLTTLFAGWLSSTSATLPTYPNKAGEFSDVFGGIGISGEEAPTGTMRFSLASTTTIYLSVYENFSVSTSSAYGYLRARRVRYSRSDLWLHSLSKKEQQ